MSTEKRVKDKNALAADIVSHDVKSHANDPFFVKKAEKAKAFLKQHPIPEYILRNH